MMPRWRAHLPEYLAEAFGLGLFMVSACGFAVLFFHPGSPVVHRLPGLFGRNLAMGAVLTIFVLGIALLVFWRRERRQRSKRAMHAEATT